MIWRHSSPTWPPGPVSDIEAHRTICPDFSCHAGNAAMIGGEPGSRVPAYVPRAIDAELRECLARGGFVLLVGDSTAGTC